MALQARTSPSADRNNIQTSKLQSVMHSVLMSFANAPLSPISQLKSTSLSLLMSTRRVASQQNAHPVSLFSEILGYGKKMASHEPPGASSENLCHLVRTHRCPCIGNAPRPTLAVDD